jgi:hypothetical protein
MFSIEKHTKEPILISILYKAIVFTISSRSSVCDESHRPDALASDKKRTAEHLRPQHFVRKEDNSTQVWKEISHLWAGNEGIAYQEIRREIFEMWRRYTPVDKRFLEKAVTLLTEFQNRTMESMKDCLERSKYLGQAGIDSKEYFAWVGERYESLASKKREAFEDITFKKFRECLKEADWKMPIMSRPSPTPTF